MTTQPSQANVTGKRTNLTMGKASLCCGEHGCQGLEASGAAHMQSVLGEPWIGALTSQKVLEPCTDDLCTFRVVWDMLIESNRKSKGVCLLSVWVLTLVLSLGELCGIGALNCPL